MDRLPTEILAKVCAYAGVGYFPSLRCVSREFNRACDLASVQYAEEHGYPARLDYYSATDLARLGHTALINGALAPGTAFDAAFENGQLQTAMYLNSLYKVSFEINIDTTHLSKLFLHATANGHMDVVSWGVQALHQHTLIDIYTLPVFDAIKIGLLRRRAPASDLAPFEYLVQEPTVPISTVIDHARRLLSMQYEGCPAYEFFIDYVRGGRVEAAQSIYPRLNAADVGAILSAAVESASPEMLAWALDIIGDRNIGWEDRMADASTEAHIYTIRATARYRNPYTPTYAMAYGLPVYLALVDCHPGKAVDPNKMIQYCHSVESVRYCIARGAVVKLDNFEQAILYRNIHVAYAIGQQLCRASRLLVLHRVLRKTVSGSDWIMSCAITKIVSWRARRSAKLHLCLTKADYPAE